MKTVEFEITIPADATNKRAELTNRIDIGLSTNGVVIRPGTYSVAISTKAKPTRRQIMLLLEIANHGGEAWHSEHAAGHNKCYVGNRVHRVRTICELADLGWLDVTRPTGHDYVYRLSATGENVVDDACRDEVAS